MRRRLYEISPAKDAFTGEPRGRVPANASCLTVAVSEFDVRPELDAARSGVLAGAAEPGRVEVGDAGCALPERRVVEDVEHFGLELEPNAPGDVHRLRDPEIRAGLLRSIQVENLSPGARGPVGGGASIGLDLCDPVWRQIVEQPRRVAIQ